MKSTNKPGKELSYSKYMLYSRMLPGVFGTLGIIFGVINSMITQSIALVLVLATGISILFSIFKKREKEDEMTKYYLARSSKFATMVSTLFIILSIIATWISRAANICVTINIFEYFDLILLFLAFIYMAALGISYRYIEAR